MKPIRATKETIVGFILLSGLILLCWYLAFQGWYKALENGMGGRREVPCPLDEFPCCQMPDLPACADEPNGRG